MDSNKRFDQLESLLVDLARKQDQQSEAIARQSEAIAQQSEAIGRQSEAIGRQEIRLDNIGDQIGDVINILKISAGRHAETAQRQEEMMTEIRNQGQRLDAQSQRQDAAVEALRALLKRQEKADSRLESVVQAQLQMFQLIRGDAEKAEDLARRFPAIEGQEPRIKRLEDEVFRAAS